MVGRITALWLIACVWLTLGSLAGAQAVVEIVGVDGTSGGGDPVTLNVTPGGPVEVLVKISGEGTDIYGLQASVGYDGNVLSNPRVNSLINTNGYQVFSNVLDSDPSNSQVRLVLYSDEQSPSKLPDDVTVSIVFDVAAGATGSTNLTLLNEGDDSNTSIAGISAANTRVSDAEGSANQAQPTLGNATLNFVTSPQWYFAEGTAEFNGAFNTFLLIVNPSDANTAELRLTVFVEGADPIVLTSTEDARLSVSPGARVTIRLNDLAPANSRFGMELISTNDVPVYSERSIYFQLANTRDAGGTDSIGATAPALEWFLAEGSTRPDRRYQFIPIINPMSVDAEVEVSYLLTNGNPPVVKNITVPARSRATIVVNDLVSDGLDSADFSTRLLSTNGVPIVVERTLFENVGTEIYKLGHTALGVTELSQNWLFAEGAVAGGSQFETFILLANASDEEALVRVEYRRPEGSTPALLTPTEAEDVGGTQLVRVAANSRTTLKANNAYDAAGLGSGGTESFAVSIEVQDNGPAISAERAVYFRGSGYTARSGATVAVGFTESQNAWYLPEGAVGGSSQFESFITLFNNGDTESVVAVAYLRPTGSEPAVLLPTEVNDSSQVVIAPGARATLKINNAFAAAGIDTNVTQSVSTVVRVISGSPIAVERVMYWGSISASQATFTTRTGGHGSRGITELQ